MPRVTLKHLAARAAVSAACVSDILNGKDAKYRADTVERVRRIAAEANYISNEVARTMVTGRSMTLALILPDITNPFFPEIAKGVEERALELGYATLLCGTDDDPARERRAFRVMSQKMVDGVIFIPSLITAGTAGTDLLAALPFPVVVVDRDIEAKGVAGRVTTDNYGGASAMTALLIERGRRDILLLAAQPDNPNARDRLHGYLDQLAAHNLPAREDYILFGGYHARFGEEAVRTFLAAGRPVDAIFATSDIVAAGALRALKDAGVSVPERVALAGFDNISLAAFMDPPLTTVDQPKYLMGRTAVDMLAEAITNGTPGGSALLPTSLAVRRSV